MRIIVLDVETSGLDAKTCTIISIGAVDFLNPDEQFYMEAKPFEGAVITGRALEINGFTIERLKEVPNTQEEMIVAFIKWLNCEGKDVLIAGQNPFFDRDFIQETIFRNRLQYYLPKRILDLHTICQNHRIANGKDGFVNSNDIFAYCGLPYEPNPHHGLMGAKMEAEAFSRLIFGKGLLEEFDIYPVPDYVQRFK